MGFHWDSLAWPMKMLWVAYLALTAWMLAKTVIAFLRAMKGRPRFEKSDVVYSDWRASGASQKNIITRLGGGRNCVRLVVTRDFLWVTSYFSFLLISPFYDMEHVIPLRAITVVERKKSFLMKSLLLTYRDAQGIDHTLRLMPKREPEFLAAIGKAVV